MFCAIILWEKKWARIHHETPVLAWACDSSSVNPCSCPHSSRVTSGLQASTVQHQGWPCEFALPHSPCCIRPRLRICPKPHAQCPNLVRSALFTLSPTSQLGLGCASQRPPQPTVSTWLHPTHVKSSFEDQPNPHTLCSFPACFVHSRPELTRGVHMYRPHQRNTHSMKEQNSTQPPNPPAL